MTSPDITATIDAERLQKLENHPPRQHPHVQQIVALALHLSYPLHAQPGAHVLDTKKTSYLIGYDDTGQFVEASGNGWVFRAADDGADHALQTFITHIKHHR